MIRPLILIGLSQFEKHLRKLNPNLEVLTSYLLLFMSSLWFTDLKRKEKETTGKSATCNDRNVIKAVHKLPTDQLT